MFTDKSMFFDMCFAVNCHFFTHKCLEQGFFLYLIFTMWISNLRDPDKLLLYIYVYIRHDTP